MHKVCVPAGTIPEILGAIIIGTVFNYENYGGNTDLLHGRRWLAVRTW